MIYVGDSMAKVRRLFGTDGIRGKFVTPSSSEKLAITALHDERVICSTLMRLVGESLARISDTMPGQGANVVIGWDQRPCNEELVASLTLGLRLAGCSVTHIGICSTPFLHYSILQNNARMGCMITASHNPVSDSGVKVFDNQGYKTSPQVEDEITLIAEALAQEEREIDDIDRENFSNADVDLSDGGNWAQQQHPLWLSKRMQGWSDFGQSLSHANIADPLLLDCSKGAPSTWLATWLGECGINSKEVSQDATAMNDGCGAGELSPTDTWTIDEASNESHLLLRNVQHAPIGTIVGAALDGDGDRCLIIEATETGYKVIDGDAIADLLLKAAARNNPNCQWHLAASIESDLALLSNPCSGLEIKTSETAVGDRWLSVELRNDGLLGEKMPKLFGVEDSGHVVLPSPHPLLENHWSLVGDGAATLVSYLLAKSCVGNDEMVRGWKKRISVSNVDRNLWDGRNQLSDTIADIAFKQLNTLGELTHWNRHGLAGEENLMLIEASLNDCPLSLGIRNSGTQAKISISLRLGIGLDHTGMEKILDEIASILGANMRL